MRLKQHNPYDYLSAFRQVIPVQSALSASAPQISLYKFQLEIYLDDLQVVLEVSQDYNSSKLWIGSCESDLETGIVEAWEGVGSEQGIDFFVLENPHDRKAMIGQGFKSITETTIRNHPRFLSQEYVDNLNEDRRYREGIMYKTSCKPSPRQKPSVKR